MEIAEGVDSGDIILQEQTPIAPRRISEGYATRPGRGFGAALLNSRSVALLATGAARPTAQDHAHATYAPRLKKEDGLIHWGRGVREIVNLVRGLSPQPCACTSLGGKMLKIFSATGREATVTEPPGKVILPPSPEGLAVAVADGYVLLQEVRSRTKSGCSSTSSSEGTALPAETVLA